MNTKKMIAVMAVLAMAVAAFAFAPVVVDGAEDKEIVYMNGEVTSTLTGTTGQLVIIDKDMTVKTGGSVTIAGDLLVKEGVTVTIEDGVFTITGDATIDGTIISKAGDKTDPTKTGLVIEPAAKKEVVINGTVSAIGNTSGDFIKSVKCDAITANTDAKITVNGNFVIGTNATACMERVEFTEKSLLTVYGELIVNLTSGEKYIKTSGNVLIDGKATAKIALANPTAVIEIKSVEGTLTVTDDEMFAYTYGGVQYYVDYSGAASDYKKSAIAYDKDKEMFYQLPLDPLVLLTVAKNEMTVTNVKNISIKETVTTAIAYDDIKSENKMYAETKMIVAPLEADKAVEGTGSGAAVATSAGATIYFQTMVLEDISASFGGATVTIEGDVTYPLQESAFTLTNSCTDALDIAGSLAILKKDSAANPLTGNVKAAWYYVKDADNKVNHYYTTAQKAIDNGATDITMMGKLIVEKDLTVPAPVKLKTATIAIYAVEVKEGATFTIANGAQYDLQGNMKVEGTFVVENIDYGIKFNSKNIYADVQLTDGSYQMYTDVYNAFAKAKAGDEIKAYKPVNDVVRIDKDITLPANVKFDNAGKNIQVFNGAVFTIAGNLYIDDASKLKTPVGKNGWNDKTPAVDSATGAVKDYSVIVIGADGVITFKAKSLPAIADAEKSAIINGSDGYYDKFKIAGAYFLNDVTDVKDAEYYIANIPLAFSGILDAKFDTVYVLGEVTIDNVKVSGTEKERAIVNIDGAKTVTMKGFTFAYATVNAAPDAILTGDIGTATGKIVFNEAKVTADAIFTEEFLDDAMNFKVIGYFQSNNATEISGIVYLDAFNLMTDYFATGYNLLTYAEKRFTVPAGTALFVNGVTSFSDVELLIAGEATVMKSATLTVGSYLSVTGTLTVAKTDGTPGLVNAASIIVGGSTDSFDKIDVSANGNALVTGAGSFNLNTLALYVFKGANVSADVLADWMANTAVSTEFYVDGSLWMTAYTPSTTTLPFAKGKAIGTTPVVITENLITPALKNVKFNGWQTYDEKTKTYADVVAKTENDTFKVGQAGYEKVYADLAKEIYNIVITADVGIDNIYIDGVIMTKIAANNTFEQTVAAGTHTISYELANGYSGNAYITSIDGKTLVGSGLSFTVNDDKYDSVKDKMDITLSGIVKSGIDVDPETHPEKSTGLTVTEILLIVVVIIMAIMAVVLILRLNRS